MYNFLIYLAEVAVCQTIFCLLYLAAFRNLSFFQLNRIFLLSATFLSFIIPVLSIPFWYAAPNAPTLNFARNLQNLGPAITSSETAIAEESFFSLELLIITLAFMYIVGVAIRLIKLCGGIIMVYKLIKNNEIRKLNGIKTIHLNDGPSFFAFLNYVFINKNKVNLSSEEMHQVIKHEQSHIIQKHTIDNLFMELAITICWFNPLLRLMKRELNNVHEFYADQEASVYQEDVASYASLILRLSSSKDGNESYLSHQFSMFNIKKRIIMLNKKKSSRKIALRYLAVLPCLVLLLAMFSFTRKAPGNSQAVHQNKTTQVIGNIAWEGNTIHSDNYLNEYLGLKTGDQFDEAIIDELVNYKADGSDLASLFMDKGHLFFTVQIKKAIHNERVDLTFEIYEGEVMSIGNVTVGGNKNIPSEDILKMIDIKAGDLFSRSQLIASQRKIIESGQFDPDNVIASPIPQENGTVDLEFMVSEL